MKSLKMNENYVYIIIIILLVVIISMLIMNCQKNEKYEYFNSPTCNACQKLDKNKCIDDLSKKPNQNKKYTAIGNFCVEKPSNALEMTDPKAVSLGYVEDSANVDKKYFPNYQASQTLANSVLYTSDSKKCKDGWGTVNSLFPGKCLSGNGWLSTWAKKR